MNKKFLLIERRSGASVQFWHQIPEVDAEQDQIIRSAWYNIDLTKWDPKNTGHEEHDHTSAEGISCDEAGYCVCGPYQNTLVGANTHIFEVKVKPAAYPIIPLSEDSDAYKHYQARLDYNAKYNITVRYEWVDADEHWHTIE
jgi:hypothetical protein